MPRKRNGRCVFTGTVKSALKKLPNKTGCTRRLPIQKDKLRLSGGPWDGQKVVLTGSAGVGYCTLPMCINGFTGRYVGGRWESFPKKEFGLE